MVITQNRKKIELVILLIPNKMVKKFINSEIPKILLMYI